MKNALFGTTALVAASFAGAALAQFEVKVGGGWSAGMGFGQYGEGDNQNKFTDSFHVISDGHIKFSASQTLDNGLSIDFVSTIEPDTQDNGKIGIDDSYVKVSSSFGSIAIGSTATAYKTPGGSTAYDTGYTFTRDDFGSTVGAASDDIGVHYYTPNISGFSAGVSFVPRDMDKKTGDITSDSVDSGGSLLSESAIAVSAEYANKLGDVDFAIGGAYFTAKGNWKGTSYQVGAKLGFQGFGVRGVYERVTGRPTTWNDNGDTYTAAVAAVTTTDSDGDIVTLVKAVAEDGTADVTQNRSETLFGGDVSYATGPWSIAVGAAQKTEKIAGKKTGKILRVGGQAGYKLGEGVNLTGRVDYSSGSTSRNNLKEISSTSGSLVLGISF